MLRRLVSRLARKPTGFIVRKSRPISLNVEVLDQRIAPVVVVSVISSDPQLTSVPGIATDGTNLYVTNYSAPAPGQLGAGQIFTVPISGGAATLLYTYHGAGPFSPNPHSIMLVGNNLVWADSESGASEETQVFEAPKDGKFMEQKMRIPWHLDWMISMSRLIRKYWYVAPIVIFPIGNPKK